MIDTLREAAEVLRDPFNRDPGDMDRLASDLLSLVEDAAIVVGLSAHEASAITRNLNLVHEAFSEIPELADLRRDSSAVSPLMSAVMRIEMAMTIEGIEHH